MQYITFSKKAKELLPILSGLIINKQIIYSYLSSTLSLWSSDNQVLDCHKTMPASYSKLTNITKHYIH